MLKVTKSLTGEVVRWQPASGSSVLLGFLDRDRVFKAAHPHLDAIDGQPWGENLEAHITTTMRGKG